MPNLEEVPLVTDPILALPDSRVRFTRSAADRRRLLVRDTVTWVVVGLIHVFFILLLALSLAQNREKFGHRSPIETILDLSMLNRDNAPPVNMIKPDVVNAQEPDISAKPITIIPPPLILPDPRAPAPPGDVLRSVGEALACGAGNFENLNRAQQARCKRQPWGGVRLPNGTIVLDAPPKAAPQPQIQMSGADAMRRQMMTNSGCPILSNRPCLSDMFTGNNSRAPGIPDPH